MKRIKQSGFGLSPVLIKTSSVVIRTRVPQQVTRNTCFNSNTSGFNSNNLVANSYLILNAIGK